MANCGCGPSACYPPYVCPPPEGLSVADMTVTVDPDQTGVSSGTRYVVTVTFSDGTVKTSTFVMPPSPAVTAISVTLAEGPSNGG